MTSVAMLAGLGSASSAVAGDPIEYTFEFVNGTTINGVTDDKEPFLPDAGGTSVENPIGMTVHVSCSDEFPGGFGEKEGPDPVRDSAWQIERYEIIKGDKRCGDSFAPPPGTDPSIDLVKTVNGEDANSPTGPTVRVGDTVTLGYRVTNDGDTVLDDIVLEDLTLGIVDCPQTSLDVDESMDCDEQTELVTAPGQVFMEAEVTGKAPGDGGITPGDIANTRDKTILYAFQFVNGTTITGQSEDKEPFIPNAGGTSAENPIGMAVHISCSDDFPGGFGEKAGPDPVRDSAWQIEAYEIVKVKDGEVDKRCGGGVTGEPRMVSDTDPIHYIAEPGPSLPPPDECIAQADGDGQVKLSWDGVDGASRYAIFRDGRFLASTRQLVFVDVNAPETAGYRVRAAANGVRSAFVDCEDDDTPPPPSLDPPEVCTVFLTPEGNKVTWAQVEGAVRYAIYRNDRFLASDRSSPYLDTTGSRDDTYTVRAVDAAGNRSAFVDCDPGSPSG